MAEVPKNLKWCSEEDFSQGPTTIYRLSAPGGYNATLWVRDWSWEGYGWPSKPDEDGDDILKQRLADERREAAAKKREEKQKKLAMEPRLFV